MPFHNNMVRMHHCFKVLNLLKFLFNILTEDVPESFLCLTLCGNWSYITMYELLTHILHIMINAIHRADIKSLHTPVTMYLELNIMPSIVTRASVPVEGKPNSIMLPPPCLLKHMVFFGDKCFFFFRIWPKLFS